MKIINYLLALTLLVVSFSCSDDDDVNESISETVTVDATSFANWTYFSFKLNKVVAVDLATKDGEYKIKANWDIAFHRGDFKLNGGVSGNGKGAAIRVVVKGDIAKFEEYPEAPETGYSVDTIKNIITDFHKFHQGANLMSPEGRKPTMEEMGRARKLMAEAMSKSSFSKVMDGAFAGAMPVKISNDVYVIKTANGMYVKIMITSYKKIDKTGMVTFKYVYQPDGSRKFR